MIFASGIFYSINTAYSIYQFFPEFACKFETAYASSFYFLSEILHKNPKNMPLKGNSELPGFSNT